MSPDELRARVGAAGDALWGPRLAGRRADQAGPRGHDEAGLPRWSLVWQMSHMLESQGEPPWLYVFAVLVFLPAVVLDAVNLLVRIPLWPAVLLLWRLERWQARRRGLRYFCAACHHAMNEPWVCCPERGCPRPLQPRLVPRFNSLFVRDCAGCGRTRWRVLGGRLWWPDGRIARTAVCRHTATSSGCYRRLGVPDLAGQSPAFHVALTGTTAAVRQAVLGHALTGLTAEGYAPAAPWVQPEVDLAAGRLLAALEDGARGDLDRPGRKYTLGWTTPLRGKSGRPGGAHVLCLHHLLGDWFASTDGLAGQGVNWGVLSGLVLALPAPEEGETTGGAPSAGPGAPGPAVLPPEEVLARALRVTEEYLGLGPADRLPFRVALVVPFAAGRGEPGVQAQRNPGPWLREAEPAVLGLAERAAGVGRVRVFTGVLPGRVTRGGAGWLVEAVRWAAGLPASRVIG